MLIQDFLNSLDIVHYEDMKTASVQYYHGQNVSYDIVVYSGEVINKRDYFFPHIIMPYSNVQMETRRAVHRWSCPFFWKNGPIKGYEYYTDLPLKYFPLGLLFGDELIFTSEIEEIKCRAYLIQIDIFKKAMWGPLQFNGGTHIAWEGSVGRNNDKRPKKEQYFEKVNNTNNEIELTQLS